MGHQALMNSMALPHWGIKHLVAMATGGPQIGYMLHVLFINTTQI